MEHNGSLYHLYGCFGIYSRVKKKRAQRHDVQTYRHTYRKSQFAHARICTHVADGVFRLVVGLVCVSKAPTIDSGRTQRALPPGVQSADMKIIDLPCLMVLFQLFAFGLNSVPPAPSILSPVLLANSTTYDFPSPDNTTFTNGTK